MKYVLLLLCVAGLLLTYSVQKTHAKMRQMEKDHRVMVEQIIAAMTRMDVRELQTKEIYAAYAQAVNSHLLKCKCASSEAQLFKDGVYPHTDFKE